MRENCQLLRRREAFSCFREAAVSSCRRRLQDGVSSGRRFVLINDRQNLGWVARPPVASINLAPSSNGGLFLPLYPLDHSSYHTYRLVGNAIQIHIERGN